jgi:hypothetical protein
LGYPTAFYQFHPSNLGPKFSKEKKQRSVVAAAGQKRQISMVGHRYRLFVSVDRAAAMP